MTGYTLAIADRLYSSWSLRAWLLFEHFGIDVTVREAPIMTPEFTALLAEFGGARTAPALRFDAIAMWDSLAIAETLAERHPQAGIWPADPARRALARSLSTEMHSSFRALRGACSMNLRHAFEGFVPSAEVLADLARITDLWAIAREASPGGPWLFGDYSVADAFFAPVAARIGGYRLTVAGADAEYIAAHLADPAFRRWRAMALARHVVQPQYEADLPHGAWPGPVPLPAHPVAGATPINARCPYSGKPVAEDSLAEIDGRVIGFCNPFCRDKSVADAAAWPALAPLLGGPD